MLFIADFPGGRRTLGFYSTFERNARVRSCCGFASTSRGRPALDDHAAVHEDERVADLAGEADLVRDDDHRHARRSRARASRRAPRRRARGRAPRSARRRASASAASRAPVRSRRAAAGRRRAGTDSSRPCRRGRPARAAPSPAPRGLVLRHLPDTDGASMTFSSAVMCGKRLKRWKTIPISARLRQTSRIAQLVELVAGLAVADELAVDPQAPRVDLLEVVDAAEERRLAGARRAEDAHHLAGLHLERDALQHLEPPEALVHALGLDHRRSSVAAASRDLRLRTEPLRGCIR